MFFTSIPRNCRCARTTHCLLSFPIAHLHSYYSYCAAGNPRCLRLLLVGATARARDLVRFLFVAAGLAAACAGKPLTLRLCLVDPLATAALVLRLPAVAALILLLGA